MHKKNNLDFLRLIFALFVIISHSYPLSGVGNHDWLYQITNKQLIFSDIGVTGFFIISGFLIFQSLERSENLIDYYWKRALRLFPALIVVLLSTVALAPFVYEGNTTYLSNMSMWSYIPNNLSLYRPQYHIDGIFENNPYKSAINGSLWTIQYEFTMYFLLSFLLIFRKKKSASILILSASFVLLAIANIFFIETLEKHELLKSSKNLLNLGSFFIAGSLLASIKINKSNKVNLIGFISFALLITSIAFNQFDLLKLFTLPLVVICFGLGSTPIINNIGNKIGDLSYGIYLLGFPVQQTLVHYFKQIIYS
ncbi:acyltransferase family protein [Pontibacter sp. MBLB2868]|uniref:acyltransferase family protein n=1 Tax=Pontibacter sp. MBLB2868 TaxID=3451555 RepID=UPI003F74B4A4